MANVNVFVPKDGSFVKLDLGAMSFNDTAERLGYHPNQLRMFSDSDKEDIYDVGYKIFTTEIVCVVASGDTLDAAQVRDYTATYTAKYDSYEIEGILDDGIANASLTSTYLAEVLKLPAIDPNGSVVSHSLGYELVFLDGKLIGYHTSDGFNKWAKSMKDHNPKLFSNYVVSVRKRGGDESMVREEVNAQADAFANIPQGLLNPLIDNYRSADGTIDFVKLKATHYN